MFDITLYLKVVTLRIMHKRYLYTSTNQRALHSNLGEGLVYLHGVTLAIVEVSNIWIIKITDAFLWDIK